eukprot:809232-Rhodomonas_salina.1
MTTRRCGPYPGTCGRELLHRKPEYRIPIVLLSVGADCVVVVGTQVPGTIVPREPGFGYRCRCCMISPILAYAYVAALATRYGYRGYLFTPTTSKSQLFRKPQKDSSAFFKFKFKFLAVLSLQC